MVCIAVFQQRVYMPMQVIGLSITIFFQLHSGGNLYRSYIDAVGFDNMNEM